MLVHAQQKVQPLVVSYTLAFGHNVALTLTLLPPYVTEDRCYDMRHVRVALLRTPRTELYYSNTRARGV